MVAKSRSKSGAPARQNRQVDLCVERILSLIQQGKLRPGQRLGEGMLSKLLGMGMAPVKMALDQLAFAGVIVRRPRSGSYVAEWSLRDYLQVMQLRAGLEAMSASLASTAASAEELDLLLAKAKSIDQMIRPYLDGKIPPRDVYNREVEFHTAVAAASGNRYILRTLADQRVLAECIRAWIARPPTVSASADAREITHVFVAEAIRSRDPEIAGRAMRQHILTGLDTNLF